MGSRSGRALADQLGAVRVYPDGKYRPRRGDIVINWGSGLTPEWNTENIQFINKPESVARAANKLHCLHALRGSEIACVEFKTDLRQVVRAGWEKAYSRRKLTGHSGEGIVVFNPQEEEVAGKMYTKAVDSQGEYRVHVMRGEVIDYAKKLRRVDDEPTQEELDVRSHDNGWVFVRGNLRRIPRVEKLAQDAVEALGLDFGSVDICMDKDGDIFVLEVNTACGLEETTLSNYISGIQTFYPLTLT
jgi:hypothetical protein